MWAKKEECKIEKTGDVHIEPRLEPQAKTSNGQTFKFFPISLENDEFLVILHISMGFNESNKYLK